MKKAVTNTRVCPNYRAKAYLTIWRFDHGLYSHIANTLTANVVKFVKCHVRDDDKL